MTGHIPESFIEVLLSSGDIVEIIGSYIELRRAGTNFVSHCPFHAEKTPSFTVNRVKQFYHCFGCGASGDALRFLMEYSGLHFVEAVEALAERLGLVIPRESQTSKTDPHISQIYASLADAAQYFQAQLSARSIGEPAVEYLKSRGITRKTVKEFNLGFAPPVWDGLLKTVGKNPEAIQNLQWAGLIIRKENGRYYDRFRDRILFPIRDRRGRVVGFGGRVIGKGEPKYLNSPETSVFSKGQQLYGLYEARLHNRSLSHLIVVEGYIDVITLAQFGITEAVATLGTALTEKHLELLFGQVNEILFCFDGDHAGKETLLKALHLCLPFMSEGRRAKFVTLPVGDDPDSFIRKNGKTAFLAQLQNSKSLSDFLFEQMTGSLDLTSIEGRAELTRLAKPLILKLPKGVFQQMMFERLEQLAGLSPGVLQGSKWGRSASRNQKSDQLKNELRVKKSFPISPAIKALALLLENRTLLGYISDQTELNGVDTQGTALLCAIIEVLRGEATLPLAEIEKRIAVDILSGFSLSDLTPIARSVPTEGIEAEFLGAMVRLRKRKQEQVLEGLLKQATVGQLTLQEKLELRKLLDQKEKNGID